MIPPLNIDMDRLAIALLQHLRIERVIALHRRDIFQAEIRFADGRQDADHRQHRVHAMRHLLAASPGRIQRRFHRIQHACPHSNRRCVQFHVETRKLRHHQGIVQCTQIGFIDRIRQAGVIQQPGFQFEARNEARIGKTAGFCKPSQAGRFIQPACRETAESLRPKNA